MMTSMQFEELSPVLTFLDWLLQHPSAVISVAIGKVHDDELPATANLASSSALHAQFLRNALHHLSAAVSTLGLRICVAAEHNGEGPAVGVCEAGTTKAEWLSRAKVRALAIDIEHRLSDVDISLHTLQPVAEQVMQLCTEFIANSSAAKDLDLSAVRKCRVAPATFFNEEWSVGLETAWQASGAEGLLTMPNYAQWTPKHAAHRTQSRTLHDGEADVAGPLGRLWRLERWSCMQAPCHEVIHLVQHAARGAIGDMNLEVAEHDGSFSTCLLMLAVADYEKQQLDARKQRHVFYPGGVEEAMLEIAEFVRRMLSHETAEARERWSVHERQAYNRWRDSFGSADMAECWGPGGNFGGNLKREALCKQVLALEAVCPRGRLLSDPSEIAAAAEAMLTTMFPARARARATQHPLHIAPEVRLSGMTVQKRLETLLEPLGVEKARGLCRELEASSVTVTVTLGEPEPGPEERE